MKYNPQEK